MSAEMSIFRKLFSSLSPEATLVSELADIAGQKEALVQRLKRHGALCTLTNIKTGLEELVRSETPHVKELKAILADRDTWPRPPEPLAHEGINNWERLSTDLAILSSITVALQRQAIQWTGVDSAVSTRLFRIAAEDGENEALLRDLALRCDPQGLD